MKTVIFSNYDSINNPYYGGGGARSIHMVASNLGAGYKSEVICGRFDRTVDKKIDNVDYHYIGSGLFGPKLSQLEFSIILPFYALSKKFDIWFDSFTPPFSVSVLPLLFGNRIVGLVHMLSGQDMFRKYGLKVDFVEQIGLKFYQNIIVTSESIKHQISRVTKNKVFVIPNSVDPFPRINTHQNNILYIGRIEINQKGIDTLIDAYSEISNPPILNIAGYGNKNEVSQLLKLIDKSKNKQHIKYLGKIEGSEKVKIFCQSQMVIVPSRFETFSIVCLEALANRIPLITSDIANLNWIPRDTRFIFKCGDKKTLADTIRRVIAGSNVDNITQNGYRFSLKFSTKKVLSAYLALIKKLT